MDLQTIQSILGIGLSVVAIIGIPLGVYKFYVKDQQTDGEKITINEKSDIILAKDIQLLRTELTGEIQKLAAVIHAELKGVTMALEHIKLNDLHTIQTKQESYDLRLITFEKTIVALTTIIDERVPRKTVEEVK